MILPVAILVARPDPFPAKSPLVAKVIALPVMVDRSQRQRKHRDLSGSYIHSGFRAQDYGIPETMVCMIRMFMWSLGP